MKIKREKLTEVVVDVICDVCGCSCKKITHFDEPEYDYEYATLKADWGYYSDSDGKSWRIELCENCFYDTLAHLKLRCKNTKDNQALIGATTKEKDKTWHIRLG